MRLGKLGFVWRGPVAKTVRLMDEYLPGAPWDWFFTGITIGNWGFGFMWRRRAAPPQGKARP